MSRPLCFVLMPFGQKPGASGRMIDFDAVYKELIAPAIDAAGLESLRADEETVGGIIHKPMFERLVLCEYAVADLTTANANVFYELGIRHAVRAASTISLFAEGQRLPFDVEPLRAIPYQLSATGEPANSQAVGETLTRRLQAAKDRATDSPLFHLLDGMVPQTLDHEKTDVFRRQVDYANEQKERLASARDAKDVEGLRAIEAALGDLSMAESGVVIDLFLSYRALSAWAEMASLTERMSPPLRATAMVQEQLALALNRLGDKRAERVLLKLLEARGPSSETYGILGRVYKDQWAAAAEAGEDFEASGLIDKSIDAYLKGFESDWRDAYPGVNAATLMELREPPDSRQEEILPVVTYSVKRKVAAGQADYWDHATLMELAVLRNDERAAMDALRDALGALRESWEAETTLNNLRLIRAARGRRGTEEPWLAVLDRELAKKAQA